MNQLSSNPNQSKPNFQKRFIKANVCLTMRSFSLIVFISFLFFSCSEQLVKVKKNGLWGKVESVIETRYSAKEKFEDFEYIQLQDSSSIVYDSLGNKKEDFWMFFWDKESGFIDLSQKFFNTYQDGKLISQGNRWGTNNGDSTLFTYNDKDSIVGSKTYDLNGKLKRQLTKIYEDSKIIQRTEYLDTNLVYTNISILNNNGRPSEIIRKENESLISRRDCYYNDKNQLVSAQTYDKIDRGDESMSFNENEDVISIIDNQTNDKSTFDYTYDSIGNWTKRIKTFRKSSGKVKYEITTRKIIYYK